MKFHSHLSTFPCINKTTQSKICENMCTYVYRKNCWIRLDLSEYFIKISLIFCKREMNLKKFSPKILRWYRLILKTTIESSEKISQRCLLCITVVKRQSGWLEYIFIYIYIWLKKIFMFHYENTMNKNTIC